MRNRLLGVIAVAAVIIATAGLLRTARLLDEAPRTPWGEPDLQGIWTDPYQTPLERSAQFAGKEVFTDEERAALDKQRAVLPRRDQRLERGTERDVAGAYNAVFQSVRPSGKRTSLVVDPSGKIVKTRGPFSNETLSLLIPGDTRNCSATVRCARYLDPIKVIQEHGTFQRGAALL